LVHYSKGRRKNNSSRAGICVKKSRTHLADHKTNPEIARKIKITQALGRITSAEMEYV